MIYPLGEIPSGFVVPGFLWSGIASGIKGDGALDLALIYSETPCVADGLFTTNRCKAAPVLLDRRRLPQAGARAVIVNSGNANAMTGERGLRDAREMNSRTAASLGVPEGSVLVCSTGKIGVPLPMTFIRKGIVPLVKGLSPRGYTEAARAIMTTDRFPKVVCARERLAGAEVSFLAIAKGAGMIAPELATMLSFVVTDLRVDPVTLKGVLKEAVNSSFNTITVDGQRSTNDTAMILANGAARNREVGRSPREKARLQELVTRIHLSLAKAMVRDGEGATKLLQVTVAGARSPMEAKRGAYAIANSNLVKAAFFGKQVNWGRIVSAVGASGIRFRPQDLEVWLGGVKLVEKGAGTGAEGRAARRLRGEEVDILVNLNSGPGKATVYFSDLTYDYVRLNAAHEGPITIHGEP